MSEGFRVGRKKPKQPTMYKYKYCVLVNILNQSSVTFDWAKNLQHPLTFNTNIGLQFEVSF